MTASPIRVTLMVAFAHLPNQAMKVRAVYEPRDPYAVRLRFPAPAGCSPREWVFARSLLVQGMKSSARGPVGDGDITVGPSEACDYVEIVLHPHSPKLTRLFARRDELASFVALAYKKVPDEQEDDWIDWEDAWSGLCRQMRAAGGGA